MTPNRKAALPLAMMPDSLSVELGVPLGVLWFVFALAWRDDQAKFILIYVEREGVAGETDVLHTAIVDEADTDKLIPRGSQVVPLWCRKRFANVASQALQLLKPIRPEDSHPCPS